MLGRGAKDKEHAMSQKLESAIAVIGIDIGKNSFHIVGHDERGAIVLRQKWSRGQVEARFANIPPCLVGMEACVGAHHLSRKLNSLGHNARLMPAKYVRPYSKGQKNDFRDAEAIAEAVQRPTMKFVATKTADQLDLQALHRVRERLVSQRTGIINQIRAFLLERGVAVRQGIRFLRAELPRILATPPDVLSPRMVRIIEDLACDWRRLDERVEGLSNEIEAIARQDAGCERLMSVPGIGPIISSAMVAAIGAGDVFTKGRDFAAWLGLVPKQIDRGPYHPRQDIQARQSLPAGSVRAGSVGRADQANGLGAPRAQALDRGSQEAAPSQRAGDCPRQQTRPHRLECSGSWPGLRSTEDGSGREPIRLIPSTQTATEAEK
jgi:transposase